MTCLQYQGEGNQPITFISRKPTHTEEKVRQLTWLISLMGWCLWKLQRYIASTTLIRVVLPDAADVLAVLDMDANMCFRVRVMNV